MSEMKKNIFSIKSDMNGMKGLLLEFKHKFEKESGYQKKLTKQLTADRKTNQVSEPVNKPNLRITNVEPASASSSDLSYESDITDASSARKS